MLHKHENFMSNTIFGGLIGCSGSDFTSNPTISHLVKLGARIEPVTSFLLRPLTLYNAYVNPKCYRVAEGVMGFFIEKAPSEVRKTMNAVHEWVANQVAASVLTQLRANEASISGIGSFLDALAVNKVIIGAFRPTASNAAEQNARTLGVAPQDAIKNLMRPTVEFSSQKMGTIAIQTILKMALDYVLLTSGRLMLKRMGRLVKWHQGAQGIARVIENMLMLAKLVNVAIVVVPILRKVIGIGRVYLNQNTRAERIRNAIDAVVDKQEDLPNKPQLIALIEIILFTASKINPPAASVIEQLLDNSEQLNALALDIKKSPILMQLIEKMPTSEAPPVPVTSYTLKGGFTMPLGIGF